MVHCIGSMDVTLHHYDYIIYLYSYAFGALTTHMHIIRVKLWRCVAMQGYLMAYIMSNRFFFSYGKLSITTTTKTIFCFNDDAWNSIMYPLTCHAKNKAPTTGSSLRFAGNTISYSSHHCARVTPVINHHILYVCVFEL